MNISYPSQSEVIQNVSFCQKERDFYTSRSGDEHLGVQQGRIVCLVTGYTNGDSDDKYPSIVYNPEFLPDTNPPAVYGIGVTALSVPVTRNTKTIPIQIAGSCGVYCHSELDRHDLVRVVLKKYGTKYEFDLEKIGKFPSLGAIKNLFGELFDKVRALDGTIWGHISKSFKDGTTVNPAADADYKMLEISLNTTLFGAAKDFCNQRFATVIVGGDTDSVKQIYIHP